MTLPSPPPPPSLRRRLSLSVVIVGFFFASKDVESFATSSLDGRQRRNYPSSDWQTRIPVARTRLYDSPPYDGGDGPFFESGNSNDNQNEDEDDSIHFPSMMDELKNNIIRKKIPATADGNNWGKKKKQMAASTSSTSTASINGSTASSSSSSNSTNNFFYFDDEDDDDDFGEEEDQEEDHNVISNGGLGFVSTNGVVSEKINGQHQHVTGQYPINERDFNNNELDDDDDDDDLDDDVNGQNGSSRTLSTHSSSSSTSPKTNGRSSSKSSSSEMNEYANDVVDDNRPEKEKEADRQQQQRRLWSLAPEVRGWTSFMKGALFSSTKKDRSNSGYISNAAGRSRNGSSKNNKKKKYSNARSSSLSSSSLPEKVDNIYTDLRDLSAYDHEQIEMYWEKLLPAVSYLGTEKVTKVYDALRVAYRAHRGQARKSGEPFIIHPVEVSLLLAGLKMDEAAVMAGLLHDTVEDTDLTFELVEEMFGTVVRTIVEGETKVSKLPKLAFADYADEQAENLRQMFVAMTDDYRIIIVKLADRLHNMRTLKHMKPEKQIKISRETLDIFAPLAHRMGIWQFKSELEDTAFMYLYPQEYDRLNRRLRQHQTKFQDTLDKSQEILRDRLNADPTLREQAQSVTVSGRTKEIYSLWHKMETKNERNLDHIVDVVALRVVITPKRNPDEGEDDSDEIDSADRGVWLCYHVLGLVQHLDGFQPVPTRVKDYISFPKPNGYQSLHTALILNGQKVEVQIRTSMMHQVAEYGMASHWAYTDTKRRMTGGNDDLYNTPWLSSIKEWQNEKLNARDFVDSVRNELLGKRVFVFLRNGKILNLARGATAIDAAFQIHTEVGLNMHGVEINGKRVPISYELQNGDVVSILTGEGKPETDWMRFAKSRSTRSKLRSYFRSQQKERYENVI